MVTIEKEDDVVDTYKELINKPTPYTFYKFDENNELIDGAEFKLQKLNSDNGIGLKTFLEYMDLQDFIGERLFKYFPTYALLTSKLSAISCKE